MSPRAATLLVALLAALGCTAGTAQAASLDTSFTTSDGAVLRGVLTGAAPLTARPTIVEFSPYGRDTSTFDPGPSFNRLVVEDRGTGRSGGAFDSLGPLAQRDVQETLGWACRQPWSNGRLGLSGFSASAITVYNSLHLKLPCVRAAVLKSGTFELYRDLLVPGGLSNLLPGAVVIAGIGGGALQQGAARNPADTPAALLGDLGAAVNVLSHPNLDAWWRERGFRGDVNHLPILMVGGFYDVESRGAFEAYQALKGDGAHLLVIAGHDQVPKGSDGGHGEMVDWFAHHVAGVGNGVEADPRVQLSLSRGSRKSFAAGDVARYDATDWPVPGTRWRTFALDPAKSGSAHSLNDGTLAPSAPAATSTQSYPAAVSVPTQTDVPNAAAVDGAGFSALSGGFPPLTDMRLAEPLGLSYTTAPLAADMVAAGPAALDVQLASTAPSSAIWAVISDVGPDGTPNPVGVGRLSTDYPRTDPARSRTDPATGEVVQPYGDYSDPSPATPTQARRYRVEFWPLGNVFRAGHRLRLHLVGQSLASAPKLPALNTVTLGGPQPSRLLVPELPAAAAPAPGVRACRSARVFRVHVPARYRRALRGGVVRVGGRRVARLGRSRRSARVDLRPFGKRTVRVTLTLRLAHGRRATDTRRYRTCRPGERPRSARR